MTKFRVVMRYSEICEIFVDARDKDEASDLACAAWDGDAHDAGFRQVDDDLETVLIEEGDFTEERQ